MKTGKILLTALASLALSTAAYANDANDVNEKEKVTVSNWVPENPVAGQSIYVNMVTKDGECSNAFADLITKRNKVHTTKFSLNNGYYLPYMSLSNIGGQDNNTWYEYDLKGTKHKVTTKVLQDVTFDAGKLPSLTINEVLTKTENKVQIGEHEELVWVPSCNIFGGYWQKVLVADYSKFYDYIIDLDESIDWEDGELPSLEKEKVNVTDRWITYDLDERFVNGSTFVPTKIQSYLDQTMITETDIYVSKPRKDGTYFIVWPDSRDKEMLAKGHKPHNVQVAFISQDQYDYHVTAQLIADYLNQTEYYGSVYDRLVYMLKSDTRDWKNSKIAIEKLFNQFVLDEARVRLTLEKLPSSIELGTLAINGEAKDVYTFNNLPAVKINPVISYPSSDKVYDIVKLSTTDSDVFTLTTKTVEYTEPSTTLKFAPVDPEFHYNYRLPYVEYLTVNVMGITKEIELIGRNPEMSWSLDELQEETIIRFIERGVITVPFYTFGYDGMYETGADGVFHEKDVTITQIEGATDEYYIELQKVASPAEEIVPLNEDGEKPQQMHGVRSYNLIVKFNGNKIGANDAVFEIADHFTGNKIKLNIKAAQVALGVTDLKGNAIDQIDFPEEGGEKIIAVHYAGFQSTDEIQRIATTFNYPFTAEFVSAPEGETSSNRVEGTGTVYLKVSCAPAFDYTEFEILEANGTISFGREAVVTIPLTRTKTLLSTKGVNHYDTEIEMGGEKFESEIEFAAIDFVNYYSLDDIRIYTDVDVFVINDVIRWHKGSMTNGNFDTLGTVALNYRPNHADVITKGNLYIENIKNHKMIIIPLKGLATSQAKINELNGTTGIENIAAEGAAQNGEMFNVAGQRVNGAAKGLVIKNGKKFIVK